MTGHVDSHGATMNQTTLLVPDRIADEFKHIFETISIPVFEQFRSPQIRQHFSCETCRSPSLEEQLRRSGKTATSSHQNSLPTPSQSGNGSNTHSSDVEKQTAIRSDIVVALSAADNANRVAIVTDEWQGLDLSRNVIILRAPNNEVPVIIASYLYFWLMTPAWQHHLELHTRGFMNNLSRKDLMHFDVPITDVGTQVAVSRALEQAMQHNAQLDRTLNALRQLTGTHRELVMEHAAANIMRGIQ